MGKKGLRTKLLLAAGVLVGLAGTLEVGVRLLGSRLGVDQNKVAGLRQLVASGDTPVYESRPYTVFAHPRGEGVARSRKPWNSHGFSDAEWKLERTGGVPRILCLGASTTEGGNPQGRPGAYPYLLEKGLENRTRRDFEVMNAGMSGWTTAETLAAWFLLLQDFAPDVVVIHHAINDLDPRCVPGFKVDYSHFRHAWLAPRYNPLDALLIRWSDLYAWRRSVLPTPTVIDLTSVRPGSGGLVRDDGSLPPETARAFVRNLVTIGRHASSIGATVVLMTMPLRPWRPGLRNDAMHRVGTAEHNQHLRDLAAEHGWSLVDAEREFGRLEDISEETFVDLVHVSAKGNLGKATLVIQELEKDWLPSLGL